MKHLFISILFIGSTLLTNAQVPVFQWAKSIGGTSSDEAYSVAVDAAGNVYTTGYYNGTVDFDPGTGVFNLTSAGYQDVFILKLDANGNFVWAKSVGGPFNDVGQGIALDAQGNIYVTGEFSPDATTDFDPGPGTFSMTLHSSGYDVFVLKLDSNGNFKWAKQEGSTGSDLGGAIAVDQAGNVYTTGTWEVFYPYISKFDTDGNLKWEKLLKVVSSQNASVGKSIAVDASGNVYTTGYFNGTLDFDPGPGTYNLKANMYDIYVSKLDASGNFVWAKQIGGGANAGYSIALDAAGNVYTCGSFQATADFDPGVGVTNVTTAGVNDMFITKFDPAGNFTWVKTFGGQFASFDMTAITLDASGNIYTTGGFHGTADFNPGVATAMLSAPGADDIFMSKLDASGNYVWAAKIGETNNDVGNSVTVNSAGNVYIAGSYKGIMDFDPGAGTTEYFTNGNSVDLFVLKLGQSLTGINENAATSDFSFYPNPTHNEFSIVTSKPLNNETIEIYNSIGTLVYSKKSSGTKNVLDLTGQPGGLYFVNVISNGQIVAARKIVKE